MADWTVITDSQVDPDAPLTSELAYAWRDNVIAAFEGAAGAVRLEIGALPRLSAGDVVKWTQPATREIADNTTAYFYEFLFMQGGTVRFKFERAATGSGTKQLRRSRGGVDTSVLTISNTSSASAYSEVVVDLTVEVGDVYSFYYTSSSTGPVLNVRNVRICTSGEFVYYWRKDRLDYYLSGVVLS